MTTKEMLQLVVKTGSEMRAAQKGFFRSKEKGQRKDFLIKSKELEKKFDNLLFNANQSLK